MRSSIAPLGRQTGESNEWRQDGEDLVRLLDALADDDCRRIVHALHVKGDALTARELSEECGIPLSTVYRKLRVLSDVDLVRRSTELRSRGKHTSSYEPGFQEVIVTVSGNGFEAQVSPRK